MSRIHADPAIYGQRFGCVVVTVDRDLGDVMVRVKAEGPVVTMERSFRLHSLEEIAGAISAHVDRVDSDKASADIVRALRVAGQKLSSRKGVTW